MNKSGLTIFAAVALLVMASCGGKKEERTIVVHKKEAVKPKTTKKVGDFSQTRNVDWKGSAYGVTISRTADASLPLATDANGNKYYDNKISIRVLRKDGSEFYNRTFTKSDFKRYVDPSFYKNSVLYSIVLVEATGNTLNFAVSVGAPNQMVSDEYVPFTLKVSAMGGLTIQKDQKLDTSDEEDEASAGNASRGEDVEDDGEAEE